MSNESGSKSEKDCGEDGSRWNYAIVARLSCGDTIHRNNASEPDSNYLCVELRGAPLRKSI